VLVGEPLGRLLDDDAELELGQAAEIVDDENDLVAVLLKGKVRALVVRGRGEGRQELVDELGGRRDRRHFADARLVVLQAR